MLFKSDARISAYLSKRVPSSQSKLLLLMLNEDYAAEILEIPGSGINAGGTEGECPLSIMMAGPHEPSRQWPVSQGPAAKQSSTWCGICLETGLQSCSFIRQMGNFKHFRECSCF